MLHSDFPEPFRTAAALVRFLEQEAVAIVATDPATALRLALLASELRLEVAP